MSDSQVDAFSLALDAVTDGLFELAKKGTPTLEDARRIVLTQTQALGWHDAGKLLAAVRVAWPTLEKRFAVIAKDAEIGSLVDEAVARFEAELAKVEGKS